MKKILIVCALFLGFALAANAQGVSFSSNLSVGMSGTDVAALQTWLIDNGFDIPSIRSGAAGKGYFGAQTKAALIRFQNQNGIPGTGYFGPLTRAKLSGNNPGQSLRVTSPNGGETLIKGTSQVITWTGAPGILNQSGFIKLQYELPPCAEPTNPVRCMIAVREPITLASNINLSNQYYRWNVGSVDSATMCAVGTTYCMSDGRYKILICSYDSSQCDTSDNYFTISGNTTGSLPPVINNVAVPTSLTVNQQGTWTIQATDPQNSILTYSVDWGDVAYASVVCPSGYVCQPIAYQPNAYQQSSTFTHSYSRAGTYTVRFTARNNAGLTAQTSSTVVVTNNGTVSSVPQVVTPNGGEQWIANSAAPLRWTTAGFDSYTKLDLYLDQTNIYCITAPCGQTFLLDKNIPINQTYNWVVATDINDIKIQPADYKFRVCLAGTTVCDSSDNYFTIKPQTYY